MLLDSAACIRDALASLQQTRTQALAASQSLTGEVRMAAAEGLQLTQTTTSIYILCSG
jgi:hypothetical protein